MSNQDLTRYPLKWPEGWKRTPCHVRKDATFKVHGKRLSVYDGVQRVQAEMEKLGINDNDVVVSTNVKTRLDGYPRTGEPRPTDPGVCVYWQKKKDQPMRCMAIDRYTEVADNLAAIAATLEYMRGIERHGGAEILDRAISGLTALPAPTAGQRDWWTVLAVNTDATVDEVREAYRRLSREHHPDRGGSQERMAELNAARDQALRELGV